MNKNIRERKAVPNVALNPILGTEINEFISQRRKHAWGKALKMPIPRRIGIQGRLFQNEQSELFNLEPRN